MLLVIAAVTGGLMMFIYSALLLLVNKRVLPKEIQPRRRPGRRAGLGLPALRLPDRADLQRAAAQASSGGEPGPMTAQDGMRSRGW